MTTVKASFRDQPDIADELFDLLDIVFPGLKQGAKHIEALGASWESVSTPYLGYAGDRLAAHVGVIELSLIVMGRRTQVGSVHAVATHPDFRRRGLFRELMELALPDCDSRYETLILTTENPEYYEPFGFRKVQEHLHTLFCSSSGGSDGLRVLDLEHPADVSLLHRLLKRRTPVSRVAGVVNDVSVFLFNEGERSLHYSEELDAVFSLRQDGSRLELYDVVGETLPSIPALTRALSVPVNSVVTYFSPDLFDVEAKAEPFVFDHGGPSYLMVRGPFAAEGHPFMLPRSART